MKPLQTHQDKWTLPKSEMEALKDLGFNFQTDMPKRRFTIRGNHVISLHIKLNNRSSKEILFIPDSIKNLAHLEFLYLDHNSITVLNENLRFLKNLKEIDLSHNEITEIPEWFCDMPNLWSVDLTSNQISLIPNWMGNMPKLSSLFIAENKVRLLPDSLWKLSELELCRNLISIVPETFKKFSNHGYFEINWNPLRSLSGIPIVGTSHADHTHLSPKGIELYKPAEKKGNYEPVRNYYEKHPMVLARQFVEAEVLLTTEEEARLVYEAGPLEIAYLQSIFPPHYHLMQKLAQRQYPPPFPDYAQVKRERAAARALRRNSKDQVSPIAEINFFDTESDEAIRRALKGSKFISYCHQLNVAEQKAKDEEVWKEDKRTDSKRADSGQDRVIF